jgi:hypothetical protein
MLSSADENFLYIGNLQTSGSTAEGQFEHYAAGYTFVKSTESVRSTRAATELEGTTWRIAHFSQGIPTGNINAEVAFAWINTVQLDEAGACSYLTSNVFSDFSDNGDEYRAIQLDNGVDFDDRYVVGGPFSRNISQCTYSIDGDGYLAIDITITAENDPQNPVSAAPRFLLADNNAYVVRGLAPVFAESSRTQSIGFLAPETVLAATAVDGTFFFNLDIVEFGADGEGAAAAGSISRDWQEFEASARGRIIFDSQTSGTTPPGESGDWASCSIDMDIDEHQTDYSGSTGNISWIVEDFHNSLFFDTCDFDLAADGSLKVFLTLGDPEADGIALMLRGYVNSNGELAVLNAGWAAPSNGLGYKDTAILFHLVAMRYTGDPDGDADSDSLTNYQEFKLATSQSVRAPSDFNGDGVSDIVLRNISTGANRLYQMAGGQIEQDIFINKLSNLDFEIVGTGDYNGDGKADIFWRNMVTGVNRIYFMDGQQITSNEIVNRNSNLDWKIIANGDYNGDGKADVLWLNSVTDVLRVYLMDGSNITSSQIIGKKPNSNMQFVGTGDFDGDGVSDILWRNQATGVVRVYLMANGDIDQDLFVARQANLDYQIVGTGDYNGDGTSDVLWRNSITGVSRMWLLQDNQVVSDDWVNKNTNFDWQIVGQGDYDGDGNADIFWFNSATQARRVYLMNGSTIIGNNFLGRLNNPDLRIIQVH